MWEIKPTNQTCKKIMVLIFLAMKAIFDTHGILSSVLNSISINLLELNMKNSNLQN